MGGCGGWLGGSSGGFGAGTLALRSYSGTVLLPSGIDTANLRVMGPFSTSKITGSTFAAKGIRDFPGPVSIVDITTGKTILVGTLDPDTNNQLLDAANCAATLLLYALGGSQLFGAERQTAWSALLADTATSGLADVVAARLAANALALEDGDAAIVDALDQAAHQAGPIGRAARRPTGAQSGTREPSSLEIAIPNLYPVNGLDLINDNDQGVFASNFTRREGMARIYLALKTDENNVDTVPDPPRQIVEPMIVPPKGNTKEVPIQLDGQDVADKFEIIYVTPVFDAPEPGIYTNNAYEGEKAAWRADHAKLFQRAEIGLVSKILLESVGVCGIPLDSAALERTIDAMQAISPAASDLVLAARNGTGLSAGVKSLIQLASGSDQGALDFLAAVAPLIEKVHPVLARDLAQRNFKSADLARVRSALRLVSILGAMALSLELGPEYKDLTEGESGNLLHFLAYLPHVRLSPNGGNYTPGDTIQFTATADHASPNATYKWNLYGISAATLDDQNGQTGIEFETSHNQVLLKTNPSSIGNAAVNVEVFEGTGSERYSIGNATTILLHTGSASLFIEEFTLGGTTYVDLMAVLPKPHTPEGGNHYVGGTVRADIIYSDLAQNIHDTRHMEFIVPPFTGLPGSSETPPQFAGPKINPSVGGGTSGFAGIDCYDLGDRLVLIKMVGIFFPGSSTPDQIQQTREAVMRHQTNTTLSATFP